MKLPRATHFTAGISGITMTLVIGTGERLGAPFHIPLAILGTIWFLTSVVLFVFGDDAWDWIRGKRSYWQVFKTTSIRACTWFMSAFLGVFLLRILFGDPH